MVARVGLDRLVGDTGTGRSAATSR